MVYSATTRQQRLAVIQLARQLGNVGQACKRMGVDRTSFYRWKRRFDTEGESGLVNRSRAHRTPSRTSSQEMERRVLEYSLGHPELSSAKLSACLRTQGCLISTGTVHSILKKYRMTCQRQRWDLAELAWHRQPDLKIFGPDFITAAMKRNPRQRPGTLPDPIRSLAWEVHLAQFIPHRKAEPLYLLLAMEVQTGLCRVKVLKEALSGHDLLLLVEEILITSLNSNQQNSITINAYTLLHQFDKYITSFLPKLRKPKFLTILFQLNPGIESPWIDCILKWMQASFFTLHKHKLIGVKFAENELIKWCDNYNYNFKIPNYPHFERSPNEIVRGHTSKNLQSLHKMCDKALSLLNPNTNTPSTAAINSIYESTKQSSPEIHIPKLNLSAFPTGLQEQQSPLPTPVVNNFTSPSIFIENMSNQPSYTNTPEKIFAAIYGQSPFASHAYQCADCVRLTISDKSLKYGLCPIYKKYFWFTSAACEHFQPRGYSIR